MPLPRRSNPVFSLVESWHSSAQRPRVEAPARPEMWQRRGNKIYLPPPALGLTEGRSHCLRNWELQERFQSPSNPWSQDDTMQEKYPGRGRVREEEGRGGGKSLPSSQYGLGFKSLRFLPFSKLMCFSGVKCSWVLKCVQHLSDIWESNFAEQRWALIPVWMLIWPQ